MAKKGLKGLPSRQQILDFLNTGDTPAGKREIARAFGLKGEDRKALKTLLRDMADEGLLEKKGRNRLNEKGKLPPVAVIEVRDRDADGELIGTALNWKGDGPPPKVMLAPHEGRGPRRGGALGIGDRFLARLQWSDEGHYEARVIKKIGQSAHRILGVYRREGSGRRARGRVVPVDRRVRHELEVASLDARDAEPGELVMAELMPGRGYGPKRGRILERLGHMDDSRAVSLIAIHAHGIPTEFPDAALAETKAAKPVPISRRTDLRNLPLITIDPADARDHDDAVHAGPDADPRNRSGFVVTVAIADVAAYVRPGAALDREARRRGNSVYFPDRVVPMLPERLSNDLCSLRPGVDRPCLAVRMVFDGSGRKRNHRFVRGVMRSHARLSYDEVQRAVDGRPNARTEPLLEPVLEPLYAAYKVLAAARDKRAPLDLDLPEHKIEIGKDGKVKRVRLAERHDAHRLIEEFMILANVCAAESLERNKIPLLYRVHDVPDAEKLEGLRDFLDGLGLSLPRGQRVRPADFNRILARARNTEYSQLISDVILRSQSQAVYAPQNLGHFGLNLPRYAHFTSPIRRYADLIVHRGLIRAHGLGKDGLTDEQAAQLDAMGEEISAAERRAMAAERESVDRYMAAFLAEQVGATFQGRISGVTRFGLFIRLSDTGADGLVPISSIGNDYFDHDESRHALVGRMTGALYRLGDPVEVRLTEAAPITGGLRFDLLSEPSEYVQPPDKGRRGGKRKTDGKSARRRTAAGKGRPKSAKPGKKRK